MWSLSHPASAGNIQVGKAGLRLSARLETNQIQMRTCGHGFKFSSQFSRAVGSAPMSHITRISANKEPFTSLFVCLLVCFNVSCLEGTSLFSSLGLSTHFAAGKRVYFGSLCAQKKIIRRPSSFGFNVRFLSSACAQGARLPAATCHCLDQQQQQRMFAPAQPT